MIENIYDVIDTNNNTKQIILGTYADIYSDNDIFPKTKGENKLLNKSQRSCQNISHDIWVSPSDNIIDIINLQPPFTSKITRGITHKGILCIGHDVLEREREQFYSHLEKVLTDNNDSWKFVLQYEKQKIFKKVTELYRHILQDKSSVMMKELSSFYEQTLQELEKHMKEEISVHIQDFHANIILKLQNNVQKNLKKNKTILKNILDTKYRSEVKKLKEYYSLLLKNEILKYIKLKNKAMQERNDSLKAFYRQAEAERMTTTMYILSLERKKCKIKRMLLEKFQSGEIREHLKNITDQDILLDSLKQNEVPLSILNRQWEECVIKILQIFLKFMSFSLKLLPEQATFLLDFEKMVVLQLNEIQKLPRFASSILINEDDQINAFNFKQSHEFSICDKVPFVLEGDLTIPCPPVYGSRESLDTNVDLPYFRLQRKYYYAKCHGFEEINKMLESNKYTLCSVCNKCVHKASEHDVQIPLQTKVKSTTSSDHSQTEVKSTFTSNRELSDDVSSNEKLICDDIKRLQHCVTKKCMSKITNDFPHLSSYLDFTEKNYERVKTILSSNVDENIILRTITARDVAFMKLPFSVTKDKYKTSATQYSTSSEESVWTPFSCDCIPSNQQINENKSCLHTSNSNKTNLEDIFIRRQKSLSRLLQENPKLFLLFSDESYNNKL